MTASDLWHLVFGRLGLQSLPFWDMIQHPTPSHIINGIIATGAAAVVVIGALVTVFLITKYRKWGVLWSDWLTSVDHKKIGIMYIVLAFVMLARALIEALLIRTQQADGLNGGFLSADHFAQLFSTHGTIMIFFMAMPFLIGLINFVMPQQIGARDVSFPMMNSISLGLTAAGAALVMVSLVLGKFETGGWTAYPPYTEAAFNPGPGVDYWIWAIALSSIGTTMTGINFAVTIYKKRAPGMTLFRMPLFTWTALCTAILMIFAMPPLTAVSLMLALDRYLDFHFFTNGMGGNMMNFANLFWLFGHPEVYILILPAFGVYSEVFSTFSGKRLYGYTSLVYATMAIAVLSFTVWLHHFFTMGQSANINAVFGLLTMIIGIPTGVKIYDWLLTMYQGRVRFTVPLIYALAFSVLFVLGGLSGVLLANPSIDFQVHNSLFLVAHFHNMLIPGLLFGMLAGYHFWFPKAFGFRLDERWGRLSAYLWISGFILAFFPLYALGLMGMTRRTVSYFDPAYTPWMLVAEVGALVLTAALTTLVIQLIVSIRERKANAVPVGDPWDGRSLEWAIAAPSPEWNFPVIPTVTDRDPFAVAKAQHTAYQSPPAYEDITLPTNSAMGMIICVVGGLLGFALVWHMWWLAILSALAVPVAVIAKSFDTRTEKVIPAAEVRQQHQAWLAQARQETPISRQLETSPDNHGLADNTIAEAST
ncbi:cbb3-type cytochrome c oxidase subunit I [Halothiobacillus sp.]|uniref:cbb3-type cytochrome c oxidase subunit I n=1 Tax=Halothiobacillus sp. TaxID=1891311 RepID=UPI002AD39248|nr:cbb3-type cytochrome c oxidase subunit I [Halothiobacillus sp.]